MTFKLLGSFALQHWLNSSFIALKNEYNRLLHLLVILLQVLNILWSWKSLSIHGFQVIATLSRVMDDLVRSFPCGAEFSLGSVFGCWGDFERDEVPYVESSELHPSVVVLGHLLLVFHYLVRSFLSDLVQIVQIDS